MVWLPESFMTSPTTWVMHHKSHHMSHSWQVPPHESFMTSPGKWYDYLMLRAYSCLCGVTRSRCHGTHVSFGCLLQLLGVPLSWMNQWWDLSWMNHVVGLVMHDSCGGTTCDEWLMSYISCCYSRTSHVVQRLMNQSYHTCQVTPHMSCHTTHVGLLLMNQSCCITTHKWVMSHIITCHVTYMNESWYTL